MNYGTISSQKVCPKNKLFEKNSIRRRMSMEIQKVEFLQKFSQAYGPKLDKEIIKNILIALSIISDRDTGDELLRILKQM
jgi:hypothetical protein